MQIEHCGTDRLGRATYLGFVDDIAELATLNVASAPFLLFVGADATRSIPEPYYSLAERLLKMGLVYVMCWGPDCQRAEDVFDEAIVGDGTRDPFDAVMTTSHPAESICQALEFATSAASPHAGASPCEGLVIVFVGNIHWYNEGQNCLEDLLVSGGIAS